MKGKTINDVDFIIGDTLNEHMVGEVFLNNTQKEKIINEKLMYWQIKLKTTCSLKPTIKKLKTLDIRKKMNMCNT